MCRVKQVSFVLSCSASVLQQQKINCKMISHLFTLLSCLARPSSLAKCIFPFLRRENSEASRQAMLKIYVSAVSHGMTPVISIWLHLTPWVQRGNFNVQVNVIPRSFLVTSTIIHMHHKSHVNFILHIEQNPTLFSSTSNS